MCATITCHYTCDKCSAILKVRTHLERCPPKRDHDLEPCANAPPETVVHMQSWGMCPTCTAIMIAEYEASREQPKPQE